MRLRVAGIRVLVGLAVAFSGIAFGQADFSINVSPSSQTVWQAWTTQSLVTIAAINGFTGSVSFSASGLPSGATATFNPATTSGSGTSTMTIAASPGTPTGSYTVTVTGTSGSLTHNA